MAQDKTLSRIEAKLDALLEKQGIPLEEFDQTQTRTETEPRQLTPQERQALDNAPDAPATVPDGEQAARTTAQNAPDVSSSVPQTTAENTPDGPSIPRRATSTDTRTADTRTTKTESRTESKK